MTEAPVDERPLSPRVWMKMLPFFAPFRALLAGAMAAMLFNAVIDALIPIYQRYIIDRFIVPGTTGGLAAVIVGGLAAIVIQAASTVVFTRLSFRVEMGFSRDIKQACFDHLQRLSLSYYNTTPVGYIIARVMSDTDRIGLIVAWGLVDVMWSSSYVVFAVCMMVVLNARLALCLVAALPMLAAAAWWFQRRILRQSRVVRTVNSRITASFNEGVMGARTSKTLVNEDINSAAFTAETAEMYRAAVRAGALGSAFMPVMLMFGAVTAAIMLARGGGAVLTGVLDIGTLSAMLSYAISIFQPIQHISRFLSDVTSTQVNIERVSALLATEPGIVDSPEVVERYGDTFAPKRENWEPLRGDIEFDDVSFSYPDGGELVLEHFSLKVPAGTRVAIVGETGAGKSTIVNLACRFFEPTEGRILIDGRDYRERSQLWLHSNIGCVLQTPHLFSGTVRDNIRYGRSGATDDEIMEAARAVSADAVIERMPGGLDADIGEGGDTLSTGEKQLLSFARAVLADPRIFVLDEATSSIDTETERRIQIAIGAVLRGRTSFIIAHRLSTIRSADVILVVSGGRIVERGTHRELMELGGTYRRLCEGRREAEESEHELRG